MLIYKVRSCLAVRLFVQQLFFLTLSSVSECLCEGIVDVLLRTTIDKSVTGCHCAHVGLSDYACPAALLQEVGHLFFFFFLLLFFFFFFFSFQLSSELHT